MALPSDLETVLVYGTYVDYGGKPFSGKWTFTAPVRVRSAAKHTAVVESAVYAVLDSTGALKAAAEYGGAPAGDLKLLATDDPDGTPVGWTWQVKEELAGRPAVTYNLPVPRTGGDIDLTGAVTTLPPVIPGNTAVTKINEKSPDGTGKVTLGAADVGAAPLVHGHLMSDVAGLLGALDGKETAGAALSAMSAHLAAADPHPTYLTAPEGVAAFAPLVHGHAYADITGVPAEATYSRTGTLAETVGAERWTNDRGRAFNLVSLRVTVGTAPTGGPLTVALVRNGATTLITATIAAGTTTAKATPTDQVAIAPGDQLSVNIVAVGTTVAGANLVVQAVMA